MDWKAQLLQTIKKMKGSNLNFMSGVFYLKRVGWVIDELGNWQIEELRN
jgi:hypothetical protein